MYLTKLAFLAQDKFLMFTCYYLSYACFSIKRQVFFRVVHLF
ncbi:hypothetical protein WANA34_0621 [Wolbachia endosymbiont of Drosophila ananassae]|nr:hypothetical protein WANA34_0621 [Wolbachia endosymbiont of Drosophila ananassae]